MNRISKIFALLALIAVIALPATSYAGFFERLIEQFNGAVERVTPDITPQNPQGVVAQPEPTQPQPQEQPPLTDAQNEQVKIALLLPLSGPNAAVGKALFDSAMLGMFDLPSENIKLLPFDTGNNDKKAIEAINKALDQDVKLVLGPLTSSQTHAVAPIAREKNINIISFSNDSSLAKEGVFILGFTPEEQVKRVVNFAATKGLLNYSSFAPSNDFGRLVTDELRRSVGENSGRVENVFFYNVAGDGERVDLSGITDAVSETVDAVLIPEGGTRLQMLDKILTTNRMSVSNVKILGTGQWDDPATLKANKFIGAWFAGSSLEARKNFEEYFTSIYSYDPPRISSLAYDSVALAIFLSASNGDFSRLAITNPRGFSAINGIFRFREDGVCERALSVIQVGSENFIEIDPAPKSFIN